MESNHEGEDIPATRESSAILLASLKRGSWSVKMLISIVHVNIETEWTANDLSGGIEHA